MRSCGQGWGRKWSGLLYILFGADHKHNMLNHFNSGLRFKLVLLVVVGIAFAFTVIGAFRVHSEKQASPRTCAAPARSAPPWSRRR